MFVGANLYDITSATAWKEFAHIPGINKILKEKGYLSSKSINKSVRGLAKKINPVYTVNTEFKYNNSIGDNIIKNKQKGIVPFVTKHYLTINKKNQVVKPVNYINDLGTIGIKPPKLKIFDNNNIIKKDAVFHENLEKLYSNKYDKDFNTYLPHNNKGVLIQELKMYNQTGADSTRKLKGTLKQIRENIPISPKLNEADLTYNSLFNKQNRMRNSDYNKISKNISKIIKDGNLYKRNSMLKQDAEMKKISDNYVAGVYNRKIKD